MTQPTLAQEKTFNAHHKTLENGMEVVIIPNHRAPVITHMVWYKVGAAEEPKGKSGIAHFMEHLMFKGSEGFGPGEFSEKIRRLGGNDNAFTSQDFTAYFQSIASEHLETVMRMEAGRMRGMTLPPEEIASERNVVMEERRQRTDNNPRAQFDEKIRHKLYGDHPYGTPVIGWPDEIAALERVDAKDFYDDWYEPNNAILVIAGDVEPEATFTLAQEIYGAIPASDIPERKRAEPPKTGAEKIYMPDPAVRQAILQKAFLVPSYTQNKEEALALELLVEIMGGGPSSRLYKSIVIDQKLATSINLYYRGEIIGDSVLWAIATPLPGKQLTYIDKALEAEIKKLATEGITAEELSDAKTRLQGAAIYARDSLQGPAMIFGQALSTGSTIDDVEYWPHNIGQITAEQIQAVAQKYLNPDNPERARTVTGFLTTKQKKVEEKPEEKVEAPLTIKPYPIKEEESE